MASTVNTESEGVIKYQLDFERAGAVEDDLEQLNVWRSILYGLQLIGQDPARYEGYGFGNLSQRRPGDTREFIISGTQTGHLPVLDNGDYVCVLACDIAHNRVAAQGPVQPSSEALTHAMIYQLNPSIRCVMHAHDPRLWRYGLDHAIPATDASVAYGTIEMAREVERLYRETSLPYCRTLVMAGHEDGVITFGDSIDAAGQAMLSLWLSADS